MPLSSKSDVNLADTLPMSFISRFLPCWLLFLAGCALPPAPSDPVNNLAHAPLKNVAKYTSRTIDLTRSPSDAWERIRRGFAIPNLDTDLVRQWTAYYAAHPDSVQRMAERAGRYLYFIVDEINRRGLPTELALLPFVESAYDPTALSPSQAAGLWQFLPATGQHFNLQQDWWSDERRDPIASTNAALDYLAALFELQGDWYLALASYNWGEGAVQRVIAKNEMAGLPTDYLSLDLPEGPRNYVPKLQAIKNIIANPQRYAITLPAVDNMPYFVTVPRVRDIDLELAAQLAEMPLDEFKALNPAFKRPLLRVECGPDLVLPADRVQVFKANLSNYKGDLSTWKVYRPQGGESYAAIARRFGIAEAALRQANDIPAQQKLAAARSLLVPDTAKVRLASLTTPANSWAAAAATPMAKTARAAFSTPAEVKPGSRTHTVRAGDTLFSLARQYRVTVAALRAANKIKGNALQAGSVLHIPPSPNGRRKT